MGSLVEAADRAKWMLMALEAGLGKARKLL